MLENENREHDKKRDNVYEEFSLVEREEGGTKSGRLSAIISLLLLITLLAAIWLIYTI